MVRPFHPLFDGVEAVLFDFDFTLVDASEVICRAFAEVVAGRGAPPLPDEAVRVMIGRPLTEMFRVALPEISPDEVEACVVDYRRRFAPLALPMSRLLPRVEGVLARLHQAGLALAVVTSRASDGAEVILTGLGQRERFRLIVGLEQVERPKPDPEPVRLALGALGVAADRAVMVGDTPDDVRAGRAAGTRTVAVTTGVHGPAALRKAGPDLLVASLDELLVQSRD